MSISSNSVIHFTNEQENLKSILKEGFKVKYCIEENTVKSGVFKAAIPMVSFCDIPLSEIKNHILKYGSYGIGLRKEWAVSNNLNPVLYIECNSLLGDSLRDSLKSYTTGANKTPEQKKLMDVGRYIKNYQRDLTRHGITYKDYRFYDEREWRFVPDISFEPLVVGTTKYSNEDYKKQINIEAGKIKLTFEPNDISYIILKDDSEISDFIHFLKHCFKKSSLQDVDTLITRIATVDQITYDF